MKDKRMDSTGNELFCGEYERKDGRYAYHYRTRTGEWKWIYASRLSMLRNEESKLMYLEHLNISREIRDITLDDQYSIWINSKLNIRATTRSSYEYLYESYIKNSLGKERIDEITTFDIKSHYMSMKVNERVSAELISHVQNVLYQVFQSAVERNVILRNPAEKACREIVRNHSKHKSLRKGLSLRQAEALLNFLKKSEKNKRWYPVVCILIYTGLRISELAGLRWVDIDMDKELLSVDHSLILSTRGEGKGEAHIYPPKSAAGNRKIPINEKVSEALFMEKEYQNFAGIKCRDTIDGYTDFVFLNRFGGVISQATVNRAIRRIQFEFSKEKICDEKGDVVILPYITTHSLRHSFANILFEKGMSVKSVQYLMGHDDVSTTMDIYTAGNVEAILQEYREKV